MPSPAIEHENHRMKSDKLKCIYILSEKSSGSSFLWRRLVATLGIKQTPKTKHYENETLFWTKAASVLEYEQVKMIKSSVPYPKLQANAELIKFANANLTAQIDNDTVLTREDIFSIWYQMIEAFGPVFVEKSPHHLLQKNALHLMDEFEQLYRDRVDFYYIGLVRNPITTITSQIRRWGPSFESVQRQWVSAYENLVSMNNSDSYNLKLIRFEDLRDSKVNIEGELLEFLGFADTKQTAKIEKFRKTKANSHEAYFSLSQQAMQLAISMGYEQDSLITSRTLKSLVQYLYWRRLRPLLVAIYRRVKPI